MASCLVKKGIGEGPLQCSVITPNEYCCKPVESSLHSHTLLIQTSILILSYHLQSNSFVLLLKEKTALIHLRLQWVIGLWI